MYEAFQWGWLVACLTVSSVSLGVVLNIRRDAVSRARRVAKITIQREVIPMTMKHDFRLDLLESVEVHRGRLRLAEGTTRDQVEAG